MYIYKAYHLYRVNTFEIPLLNKYAPLFPKFHGYLPFLHLCSMLRYSVSAEHHAKKRKPPAVDRSFYCGRFSLR